MSAPGFAGLASPAALPRPRSAPTPAHLDEPAATARRAVAALAGLRPRPVRTRHDLLHHAPFRYEDYRETARIADLEIGREATVECVVEGIRVRPTRRRNLAIVEARVRDESGPGVVVWFNQRHLVRTLTPGTRISVRGERRGSIAAEIVARSHEVLGGDGEAHHTAGIVPIYRASEQITARALRDLVADALPHAGDEPDPVPAPARAARGLGLRRDALVAAHRPRSRDEARAARRRLAFDELLLLQTGLLSHRRDFEREAVAEPLGRPGRLAAALHDSLPFALTGAQRRAIAEIDADLDRSTPMQRLLQGDVGSGKTLVALHALLRAVEADAQGALMAPTETLATQHLIGVAALCEPLGVRVMLLVNGMPAPERRAALQVLASGEPAIAIGTHALIQAGVELPRLAVAVVDEQHRFGVEQREQLEQRAAATGRSPHVLHMTATPIPRTLSLTVYGDLDVSVLDELPPGRTPVVTRVLPRSRRDEVFARMRRLLDEGRQAYVVCPLVAESEATEATAAEEEYRRLSAGELRDYRVGCLHGQMRNDERRAAMEAFRAGRTQVLVATTVIEVGVDVPNAVIMVIEEADLFGLAQLHQLRGRVGRGGHNSFCILLADPATEEASARLAAMASTADGFELAEVDLELRGEGSLMAARQSGMPDLRHARLREDRALAAEAREEARALVDAGRADPDDTLGWLLRRETERLFGDALEWALKA